MNLMKAEQIPQFVQDVVALGCEICATSNVNYVFGDADLPFDVAEALAPEIRRIDETYGCHWHLKREIIAYLNSIGRYVDLDDPNAVMRRH